MTLLVITTTDYYPRVLDLKELEQFERLDNFKLSNQLCRYYYPRKEIAHKVKLLFHATFEGERTFANIVLYLGEVIEKTQNMKPYAESIMILKDGRFMDGFGFSVLEYLEWFPNETVITSIEWDFRESPLVSEDIPVPLYVRYSIMRDLHAIQEYLEKNRNDLPHQCIYVRYDKHTHRLIIKRSTNSSLKDCLHFTSQNQELVYFLILSHDVSSIIILKDLQEHLLGRYQHVDEFQTIADIKIIQTALSFLNGKQTITLCESYGMPIVEIWKNKA